MLSLSGYHLGFTRLHELRVLFCTFDLLPKRQRARGTREIAYLVQDIV